MDRPVEVLLVPVERVVPRGPGVVGLEEPVGVAAGLMATCGSRHLAVVDSDGRLVGILSEAHLRARLRSELEAFPDAARKLLEETVESVMPRNALSVSRRAPLRDALAILLGGRVGALPVTNDDDQPIGIVSYVDLLAYLAGVVRRSRAGPGQGPCATGAGPRTGGRRLRAAARSREGAADATGIAGPAAPSKGDP